MKSLMKVAFAAVVALSLAGCAKDMAAIGAVSAPVNTGIAASAIINAATTYDGLKVGVAAFAQYCVARQNTPAACSVQNRRTISAAIRTGDAARNSLEASLRSGSSVGVTAYTALTNSITALQATPVPQFTAAK